MAIIGAIGGQEESGIRRSPRESLIFSFSRNELVLVAWAVLDQTLSTSGYGPIPAANGACGARWRNPIPNSLFYLCYGLADGATGAVGGGLLILKLVWQALWFFGIVEV